jgi:hypothetical protein
MVRTVGIDVQKCVQEGLAYLEPVQKGEPLMSEAALFIPIDENAQEELRADFKTTHLGVEMLVDVRFTAIYKQTKKARSRAEHLFEAKEPTTDTHEKEKDKKYHKSFIFPGGAIVFFCTDGSGGWNATMFKHFREARDAKQKGSRMRIRINRGGRLEDAAWVWALETISLGICRANYEYMKVAREGRLPNGLSKQEALERTERNKRKKREANEEEGAVAGIDEAGMIGMKKMFEAEECEEQKNIYILYLKKKKADDLLNNIIGGCYVGVA